MAAPLWHSLSALALYYGRRVSPRDLAAHSPHEGNQAPLLEVAAITLKHYGFDVSVWQGSLEKLKSKVLPILLPLKNGDAALSLKSDNHAEKLQLFTDGGSSEVVWTTESLMNQIKGEALLAKPNTLISAQAEAHGSDGMGAVASNDRPHWFWSVFRLLKRHYGDCILAALLINLLALATSMFSMTYCS